MVQILPQVDTFGSQLARILPQAFANIGQGFQQRRENISNQNVLNQLAANPDSSPLQQIQAFSSLSPGAQQSMSPLFTHLLDLQKAQIGQKEKQAAAMQAEQQEHEDVSSTLNRLTDELMEGRTGKLNFLNRLSSKGRESRAYFDELALGIEKRLANMVGKGALSQARFDYLKKNLPSSSDTDATNRGRLRALAEEFKVDIKNPQFKSALKKSEDMVESHRSTALSDIFK